MAWDFTRQFSEDQSIRSNGKSLDFETAISTWFGEWKEGPKIFMDSFLQGPFLSGAFLLIVLEKREETVHHGSGALVSNAHEGGGSLPT